MDERTFKVGDQVFCTLDNGIRRKGVIIGIRPIYSPGTELKDVPLFWYRIDFGSGETYEQYSVEHAL
jgi:hypothetical protein